MWTFRLLLIMLVMTTFAVKNAKGQTAPYNGLNLGLGNLSRLSHVKTRSISPENLTGEKGKGGMATEGTGAEAARDLGQGWKISPSFKIGPKKVSPWRRFRGREPFSTFG